MGCASPWQGSGHAAAERTAGGRVEATDRRGARDGHGGRFMSGRARISLLGTELDALTGAEAIECIFAAIARGEGGWVITPNLDILRRLVKDRDFFELASGATLRLADGMPLIWASRLRRTPLPERVAGSDLIWGLCEK